MTRLKRLRHRVEYIALLALAAVIRALPLERASQWSGAGWRLVAPRLRRHQRALNNLALAFPEKSPAEIRQIALGMWENLGRTFAEFFHLDEIVKGDRIRMEPPELFESLRGLSGGVICGLHMGNWEILSQAGLNIGWRPAGVYQKITNPFVDHYINTIRAPLYPAGLMEKSPRAAKAMLRYAREGGCVAFLADQRDRRGVGAAFFGRSALSTPFPAFVARSVGAPLYVCRAKRLNGVRFSISVAQVTVPNTADRDADVAAATGGVQAAFESMVREAPEQWMWAHRRWD
ncbi:lysophospholipid acyltransferase family protein [Methylocapsa sp. S129]|uniref:lysophospholipid acyltransferase family protein n=1 Tax=Methylocapsa sp. S129 TaxID=1641869 RepID=UPI00131BB630|nr:lauroyl acyltransferase [Methylocapsa sp. S129]